ncbi:MAG: recombination protein F [Candidatus Latescibacteria bacterium ADurb.Bin168]|nr:MAG: recombination protein F [Candidatus Latescibacteria bacterium ADurb.Bin168]
MSMTSLWLKNFTAFDEIEIGFSPGINVFVGANGTGKTHLMKVIYSACDITITKKHIAEKLVNVFLPSGRKLGRLVKRRKKSSSCEIALTRDYVNIPMSFRNAQGSFPLSDVVDADAFVGNLKAKAPKGKLTLRISFSNHVTKSDSDQVTVTGQTEWQNKPVESAYIPVKEMLSNAPGFQALFDRREIHFEEVYRDIILRAALPVRRGPPDSSRRNLLKALEMALQGKVTTKNDEFFLRNKQGNLEFTLLAEGLRKLGLLWVLIQNGTLLSGSVLLWDEPETNLNPILYGPVVEILLALQREGVQVFLATHDYAILKELDLRKKKEDNAVFHSLFRDNGGIRCHSVEEYLSIHPNTIAEAFDSLYDREVKRSLGGTDG